MSSDFAKAQLFFKRLLLEKISNPNIHKIYKSKFSLNLDFDLSNEDIQYLTEIISNNDNINNLTIRLSDTLTDTKVLNKLLRKISYKNQIDKLTIYIKNLRDDLFEEFLKFICRYNSSVDSVKI